MATDYKPKDYPTASPYLIVRGAERTIQFTQDVFGATVLRTVGTTW